MFSTHFGNQKCVTSWNPQRIPTLPHIQINFLFCFFLNHKLFPHFFFFLVGIFQCAKNDFLYCIFLFRRAKMRYPPWQCRLPFSPLMHSHSGRELKELKGDVSCRCTFPFPFPLPLSQFAAEFFAIFLAVALREQWARESLSLFSYSSQGHERGGRKPNGIYGT